VNKQRAIAIIVSLLQTLDEGEGWAPRSCIYLMCDMDLARADRLQQFMVFAGWLTATPEVITITEKGKAFINEN